MRTDETFKVDIKFNKPTKLNRLTLGFKLRDCTGARFKGLVQSGSDSALLEFKDRPYDDDLDRIGTKLNGTVKRTR